MSVKERLRPVSNVDAVREESEVAESDVIRYLRANPDFFLLHQDLLCDLQIPHASGTAVSLVERQVSLLRERNIDLRHRLVRIVETARHNDELFEKTRGLALQLMALTGAEELIACTRENLLRELSADFCTIKLFKAVVESACHAPEEDARLALPVVFEQTRTVCGHLRAQERRFLFAADADAVESAALVPLRANDEVCGVLAVGSSDAAYFHPDMGTVFVDFVADVLARRLAQYASH